MFKRGFSLFAALFLSAPVVAKASSDHSMAEGLDVDARLARAHALFDALDRPVDHGGVTRDKDDPKKFSWVNFANFANFNNFRNFQNFNNFRNFQNFQNFHNFQNFQNFHNAPVQQFQNAPLAQPFHNAPVALPFHNAPLAQPFQNGPVVQPFHNAPAVQPFQNAPPVQPHVTQPAFVLPGPAHNPFVPSPSPGPFLPSVSPGGGATKTLTTPTHQALPSSGAGTVTVLPSTQHSPTQLPSPAPLPQPPAQPTLSTAPVAQPGAPHQQQPTTPQNAAAASQAENALIKNLQTSPGTTQAPAPAATPAASGYTFAPTTYNTIQVFQNGKLVSTVTPDLATQKYGYQPQSPVAVPSPQVAPHGPAVVASPSINTPPPASPAQTPALVVEPKAAAPATSVATGTPNAATKPAPASTPPTAAAAASKAEDTLLQKLQPQPAQTAPAAKVGSPVSPTASNANQSVNGPANAGLSSVSNPALGTTLTTPKGNLQFAAISQLNPTQYGGLNPLSKDPDTKTSIQNETCVAAVYTMIARGAGSTNATIANFWDTKTGATRAGFQQVGGRQVAFSYTGSLENSTFTAVNANVPRLSPSSALTPSPALAALNTGPIMVGGSIKTSTGTSEAHWMLGVGTATASNGVKAIVANDPWTGTKVRIDPNSGRVIDIMDPATGTYYSLKNVTAGQLPQSAKVDFSNPNLIPQVQIGGQTVGSYTALNSFDASGLNGGFVAVTIK